MPALRKYAGIRRHYDPFFPEFINQLIAWGVDFRRDENGELCYTKEGAHSTNRILFHDDVTGKEITSKLLAQVKKLPNVTLLAHTEMCDILSCKNVCEGVLIRDEEGKLVPVMLGM